MKYEIKTTSGDTLPFSVDLLTDEEGNPVTDVSSQRFKAWFTAKLALADSDEDALLRYSTEAGDARDGLIVMSGQNFYWEVSSDLMDAVTEVTFFDFQVETIADRVKTLFSGIIIPETQITVSK